MALDAIPASPSALGGLNRLSPVRQIVLLVGLAGAVALGVMVALWSSTPNFSLLYGSLSDKDAAEVIQAWIQPVFSTGWSTTPAPFWCLLPNCTRRV